jgi:hypothetical protein
MESPLVKINKELLEIHNIITGRNDTIEDIVKIQDLKRQNNIYLLLMEDL